jgi:hypothetical protein
MSELKKQLYEQCVDYIQKRMDAAQFALLETQKASNDDTKSSAGDKYETGREMIQQETNRHLAQLNEANKLKIALAQISPDAVSEQAGPGSMVITDNGKFFIAISAGTLSVNNEVYFAVSIASPIGLMLKGLKKGNNFVLNGKPYRIIMVM